MPSTGTFPHMNGSCHTACGAGGAGGDGVRHHPPGPRDGHPQPHARLVLRPGRATATSTPSCGKAEQLVADGADLLDVGGVKAGPGPEVAEAEELDRVVPAIEALRARFDVPLSVDTWRASVADAALRRRRRRRQRHQRLRRPRLPGRARPRPGAVGRRHPHPARAPRPRPRARTTTTSSADGASPSCADRAARAEAAGIPRRADHGRRRARPRQDRAAVARAAAGARDDLAALGYPVLLSASNKRFLGDLLGTRGRPTAARPRIAAHALGIALGCRILRAHDVRGARRVADVMAAVLEAA